MCWSFIVGVLWLSSVVSGLKSVLVVPASTDAKHFDTTTHTAVFGSLDQARDFIRPHLANMTNDITVEMAPGGLLLGFELSEIYLYSSHTHFHFRHERKGFRQKWL
jgi:hypothetical protein